MARAVLLAGGIALMSFGGASGAPASPMPTPVIVPLDVTMEDAGWLETTSVPAQSSVQNITEPEAVSLAAERASANELPVGSAEVQLLAVPPDFSITAPPAVPSPTSTALAASMNDSEQSIARPSTGALARGQGQSLKRKYRVNDSAIEFDIAVQLDGNLAGSVPLKIGSDRNVSVQLTELLALLRDRMDPQLLEWLSSAYSVNSHISFDQLRSAGIDVRYDAANDIVVMATN